MNRNVNIRAQALRSCRILMVLFAGLFGVCTAAPVAAYTWIEGEATTSMSFTPNDALKLTVGGWGNAQFLSDAKWFQVSVDADKVAQQVPDAGLLISYSFNIDKAGQHEIWNRIGYEFVRSPFDWRIDNGNWKTVSSEELTTDLMELQFFNEVAWLKLGQQQLSAGPHKFEIRLAKTQDDKGKPVKILYASDAILFYPGTFRPNSKYKPGENYRDARDEEATNKVFEVPDAAAATRKSVKLEGLWEVSRHDEQLPGEVAAPIKDFPVEPHWKAIPIPSDKNKSRPDLIFAHRLWYRTRVNVPASQMGRSFFLAFPQNSLNTTVYVNGVYCGFNKNPFAYFTIDVTKGVKAGVNEVWVGIKDAWYGYTANPQNPMKLRKVFNLPAEIMGRGFQDLAYPIWKNPQSGIMEAPEFVVAGGPVYASDVFVKPSVARKELAAEITLTNTSAQNATGEIQWQVVNEKTGAVEKTLAAKPFSVTANSDQVLNIADAWTNPKLWWPDEPNMYLLRTTINVGGRAIDVKDTLFGFREWSTRGTEFTLNGIVWRMWADLSPLAAKDTREFLDIYRRTNQRTFRLMMPGQGDSWRYLGLPLQDVLTFFDRNGVVVRRNGPVDGEAIGYAFSEGDPELKKLYGTEMKVQLMQNWKDQMIAQVKGERHHTSIQIWTIENEFAFINLINLLGNGPLMDEYEREISKISDAVMQVDPTRTVMTDGGGATKFQTLPVHGNHYVFSPSDTRYPTLAYEPYPEGGGRGRWMWDMKRPRFIGEDFFATGINPADYAMWGGESAFLSKTAARPAGDFLYRMLTEGYRWAGQSAWHFWSGQNEVLNPWISQAPRAVFVRQYDWIFGSGQQVKRTFGIFNDTQHPAPLTFTRTLLVNNKKAWSKTTTHTVAPGTSSKFEEVLPALPKVASRKEAQLILTLAVDGKEIFRDSKAVSILPRPTFSIASPRTSPDGSTQTVRSTNRQTRLPHFITRVSLKVQPAASAAQKLAVYDPQGNVAQYLKSMNVAFTLINNLDNLPSSKVLIIGPDALSVTQSTSSQLAAYASEGHTVLILEQKNPLKYQALPAEMDAAEATSKNDFGQTVPAAAGKRAFIEDLSHPIFRNLAQRDFVAWKPDGLVYRNAYMKPARGGRSLVQAGPRLTNSVLTEVPVGSGLMILSQLTIGNKIKTNLIAQLLLANLVNYSVTYKLTYRQAALAAGDDAQLIKVADAMGLKYTRVADPLQAISTPGIQLAIVAASPPNLKSLATNLPKVQAFMRGGGYIVFHGLTPEGLADYNKIVGFDHMIRPFKRERVTFPAAKNPLTSGLTLGDVVMLSGERIFPWVSDEYVASDIFSHVVDIEDVAPFGKSDSFLYENATNNFFQADGWKLINNFDAPANGPAELKITLNKPQTIREVTWVGNTLYNAVTKVNLVFDGKDKVSFNTNPTAEPQTFAINPPRTAQEITLQMADWQHIPGKQSAKGQDIIGIDNIYYIAKRPADFYQKVKPMLNIGGLVQYPRGEGGIVLANLLFKDTETVPLNATKKRTILSTILRNLKAPFAGSNTVIAGAKLQYEPVDISKQANQYRNERGWFGDKNFTFADLPTGRQVFAGVPYQVYEFATSPVPNAIMLGGNGVPNNLPNEVRDIPVNRKADALFFLQTARMDGRRNEQELREKKQYEMARYVVHYADGQTVNIPVLAEINIDDFKQKNPAALPGAQIAWTKSFAGNAEFSAVAYSMQWNNPRPGVEIKSIDFTYGEHKRGVPVLLALTAATAR